MGTVQAQGRSLSHPPLGYAVPQGLLEAGVSMCEQVQGLEELGKGIGVQCGAARGAWGQPGVLWGSGAGGQAGVCRSIPGG